MHIPFGKYIPSKMRFLSILLVVVFAYISVSALEKPQLQRAHAGKLEITSSKIKDCLLIGYCPMHMYVCHVYCVPASLLTITPKPPGACTRDTDCNSDEKCCKPACGCTNKCTKASDTNGFPKLP